MTRHLDDGRFDSIVRTLSARNRRRIVVLLHRAMPRTVDEVGTADLGAHVQARRTHLRLRRVDLPLLHDSGLVEWDTAAEVIARGPRFHESVPLLDRLTEHADELPAEWP